ncbi:hypothetical protein AQ490_22005 [Wenjunlia vitaminophila]|uniref:Uncharacterized protein n=1 Tax=Wenjunlia vitaminophila TaxID=76728 RepID=A0A0T6LT39_WENVI|nr:DUF6454 family protein [Wenjunlia vitaminophila]KRV48994.1 hypothetical protein AQ490_22005 [Wenjunlia vitaminophila]
MRRTIGSRTAVLAGVLLAVAAVAATAVPAAGGAPTSGDEPLARAVTQLDRATRWTLAERIRLDFPTHHPQGLTRVGDRLFLSSVEVIEPPVKYPEPVDGHDRSPGRGRGHVFVLDLEGRLLQDIVLGEGHAYHPGGIDSDGTSLWVPVAEYRQYSASIIYRIDLRTLTAHREFEVPDHVGGIVPDPRTGKLHGVTWGSREFYTWSRSGRQLEHTRNPSHFVDYQDCAYTERGLMLCTGVTNFRSASGAAFELGGIALLDLATRSVRHEVPIQLWSSAGHVATRNPVHLETDGGTLRMWAAPDDGEEVSGTELLVYQAVVG